MEDKPRTQASKDMKISGRIRLFKYISFTALNSLIESGAFKVTYRTDCNDPQEMLEYGVDPKCGGLYSERGFLSFSKNGNSAPMWGNYAEHYKGACIEFEFEYLDPAMGNSDLTDERQILNDVQTLKEMGYEVNYLNAKHSTCLPSKISRLLISCKYSENHFRVPPPPCSETEEEALRRAEDFLWAVTCTKDKDWAYEEEVRMLVSNKQDIVSILKKESKKIYLTKLPTPYIKKIILGPLSEHNSDDIALQIEKKRRERPEHEVYIPECVDVLKAKFSKYKYKLNYTNEEEIDILD